MRNNKFLIYSSDKKDYYNIKGNSDINDELDFTMDDITDMLYDKYILYDNELKSLIKIELEPYKDKVCVKDILEYITKIDYLGNINKQKEIKNRFDNIVKNYELHKIKQIDYILESSPAIYGLLINDNGYIFNYELKLKNLIDIYGDKNKVYDRFPETLNN